MNSELSRLRARVTELVGEEAALLQQALELTRQGADRGRVDALMSSVQAIQAQRVGVKQQIENLLGARRMHSADEVWKPGIYEYYRQAGGTAVRVQVTKAAGGFEVALPDAAKPVRIDAVMGFFDGPLPADAASAPAARKA